MAWSPATSPLWQTPKNLWGGLNGPPFPNPKRKFRIMLLRYTGDQSKITFRKVTFKAGEPKKVTDASLAKKLSALDYFEEVTDGQDS